jgi:PleD family two-component response regulator
MLCKDSNKGFDDTIVYTFYCHSEKFKMPRKPNYEELKQRNKETELNAKEPEALHKGNENILFIDDEECILKMVKRILEHSEYQVETKTNPAEALELFRSGPDRFDLVITDMTMPQMTGQRLAKEILDICRTCRLFFVPASEKKYLKKRPGNWVSRLWYSSLLQSVILPSWFGTYWTNNQSKIFT